MSRTRHARRHACRWVQVAATLDYRMKKIGTRRMWVRVGRTHRMRCSDCGQVRKVRSVR